MPKKVKSSACSTGWCQNHLFQLLPYKNSDCYYRKKMKLRLCPKHNPSTNQFAKTMPMINNDQKHYTPCFILQEERSYYMDNDMKIRNNHQLKLEPSVEGTILVPNHGRKKNYCSVCRTEYDDYLEHVDDISHRTHLRNNKFSKFILQIGDQMMKQQQIRELESIQCPLEIMSKLTEDTIELEKAKNKND